MLASWLPHVVDVYVAPGCVCLACVDACAHWCMHAWLHMDMLAFLGISQSPESGGQPTKPGVSIGRRKEWDIPPHNIFAMAIGGAMLLAC